MLGTERLTPSKSSVHGSSDTEQAEHLFLANPSQVALLGRWPQPPRGFLKKFSGCETPQPLELL